AEGGRGRIYLAPTPEHVATARGAKPEWRPELAICGSTQYLGVKPYGVDRFDQLFTDRQILALMTFADLVGGAREQATRDALAAGLSNAGEVLSASGTGATAYGDAVCTYLGLAVSKLSDYNASLVQWSKSRDQAVHVFGRQALPMVWDYAEINPFGDAA